MNKIYQLLFISFALVVIWFHKGLILGGGEAGIIFHNLSNELGIVSSTWVDKALGNPTGVVTSWYPYFLVFSTLQQIGIPGVIIQAALFFILLSLGSIGMYLLIKQHEKESTVAFIAALFYNLNLLSMTIVWNRFQYPYMFFYASLPLALYFFRKGISEKNILYAFLLGILTVLFATAFASVPLLLLFWFVLGGYFLFYIASNIRNTKKVLWAIFFLIVSLVLFILGNLWWLLQLLQTVLSKPYLTSQPFTSSDNYVTFRVLSENLGHIDYLIRLMHKDFFMWMRVVWGNIYYSIPFILFSFLPGIFVFGSLLIKKKPKEYYFFMLLSVFGIFFAKGNAHPFGGIFDFVFTHVSILEVFRNPFEKIGLILPLGFAPLFAYGVYYFYTNLQETKKTYAKSFLVSTLVITCGLLVWPMWNGWVFTSNEPPANNPKIGDYVKVPEYYNEADNWLNSQSGNFRTIALPLKGEGLTYNWEYGYNGVDPTSSLFRKPFLSLCTGVPYLCSLTNDFQKQLLTNSESFWKILPPLHVNNVMIREDVDYKLRNLYDPKDLHKALQDSSTNFSLSKTFDSLSFYTINDSSRQEKIFGTTSGIYHSHPQGNSFIQAVPYTNYQKGDIYLTDTDLKKQIFELAHAKQIVLQGQIFDTEPLDVSKENAELALPFVRFLPDSKLYFYSRAKEKVTRFLAGNNSSRQLVIESDKRIVEIARLIREKKYDLAEKTLEEYEETLNHFLRVPSLLGEKDSKSDLLRQKYVLSDVLLQLDDARKERYLVVDEKLNNLLDKLSITTKYPVDLSTYTSYQINVPETGTYKVLLETQDWADFYKASELAAVINGSLSKTFVINPEEKSQILFEQMFEKGRHQIDILIPEGNNLISSNKEFEIFSDTVSTVRFPFKEFDSFASYAISFDYFINKGNMAHALIAQDTDPVIKGNIQSKKTLTLEKNNYNYEWKTLHDSFIADPTAHQATLQFQIRGTNDCLDKNPGFLTGRCRDAEFIKAFNKESKVTIKNLSITRKMNNNLFLIKDNEQLPLQNPEITYQKMNPTKYIVTVKNAQNPYFLTFLESYDPRWKAYVANDGVVQEIEEEKHVLVNSYANSWYIEKNGNYDITLEFTPQRLLEMGNNISLTTVIISLIIVIIILVLRRRKYFK